MTTHILRAATLLFALFPALLQAQDSPEELAEWLMRNTVRTERTWPAPYTVGFLFVEDGFQLSSPQGYAATKGDMDGLGTTVLVSAANRGFYQWADIEGGVTVTTTGKINLEWHRPGNAHWSYQYVTPKAGVDPHLVALRIQRLAQEAGSTEFRFLRATPQDKDVVGPQRAAQNEPVDESLQAAQDYAEFNETTGMSFGVYGGQSYFKRDGGLIGVSVTKRTFGLGTFYGFASSTDMINRVAAPESEEDGSFGEYTQYQLTAGSAIPKLRLGLLGMHAAYSYQKTDRRALHLGTLGMHLGEFGRGGPVMYVNVTPVFGKPQYGIGIDLNFADL